VLKDTRIPPTDIAFVALTRENEPAVDVLRRIMVIGVWSDDGAGNALFSQPSRG
jgi:hypothetical protein